MPIDRVNELLGMMKGKKILVKGNHDKKYDLKLFEEICDFKTVSLNGWESESDETDSQLLYGTLYGTINIGTLGEGIVSK